MVVTIVLEYNIVNILPMIGKIYLWDGSPGHVT